MSTGTRQNWKNKLRSNGQPGTWHSWRDAARHVARYVSGHAGRHAGPDPDSPPRAGKRSQRPGRAAAAAAVAGALAVGAVVYGVAGSGAFRASHGSLTAETVSVPVGLRGLTPRVTTSGTGADAGDAVLQAGSRQALRRAATHAAPPASARPTPKPSPRPKVLSCSYNSGLLPYNVTTIVSFLMQHGYSPLAAAGIAGNIYQESKGDPEAVGMGGGGLIGFTPLPAGYVTGNAAADLQTQLEAVLAYNNQYSAYLPELNAASSAASAAYIYMAYYERPGIPATSTREASAEAVAAACGL